MIVIVGESASGKSTVEKILNEKYGYVLTYLENIFNDYHKEN